MRVYVASGLKNAENVKLVHRRLRELGHEVTYDWTTHGSVKHLGTSVMRQVATDEQRGVETAHRLIVLLPPPGFETSGRGTHVELGVAIGLGTPVIIHSPVSEPFELKPCAFYFSRFVVARTVGSIPWLLANLERLLELNGWKSTLEVTELTE